jgi:hypothetical protein
MIHLYGVVDQLEELPTVTGIDDGPLERRSIEGLEVVVSRTRLAPKEITQEAIVSHAHVVEELMERSRSVLPARFDGPFANEQELADAVRTKASELARGLSLVRGCVEFGLRALARDRAEGPSNKLSGRAYMQTRLAEERLHQRLAGELHEPLARLSRASARFGGALSELFKAAYLVPREDIDVFAECVRRLEAAHPDVTIVCTGPWPPYTFADKGESGG